MGSIWYYKIALSKINDIKLLKLGEKFGFLVDNQLTKEALVN